MSQHSAEPHAQPLSTRESTLLEQAAGSPQAAELLAGWIATRGQFQALAAEVDEGVFPLSAWAEALVAMHEWLTARGLHTPFPAALGYAGCCASLQGSGVPASDLRSAVLEMLERYGMEAATPLHPAQPPQPA